MRIRIDSEQEEFNILCGKEKRIQDLGEVLVCIEFS